MGLRDALARSAVQRVHVLPVEVPGRPALRVAVERAVAERGWVLASSPADTDLLVVCGTPGPRLGAAVALVWDEIPGPRARVDVVAPSVVAAELDRGAARLLVPVREDDGAGGDGDADHGDMDHGDMDHGDADHGDMDHGDADHGDMDHGDMDHGDMEMAPDGIPLAEGDEDRDGLEMDVLHLPLGPVLRQWPAGLVLTCTLHGDVVAEATAEVLDGEGAATDGRDPDHPGPLPVWGGVRDADAVAALLDLAGWPVGAALARRARDAALDGDVSAARAHLGRLRDRVRRSVVLRWSLRGVGRLDPPTVPAGLEGDAHDRLVRLLERAVTGVAGDGPPPPALAAVDLAELVGGLELATVRLLVASLSPSLDPAAAERTGDARV